MFTSITFQEIGGRPIVVGEVKAYLIWFDSYAAKSSCMLIETPIEDYAQWIIKENPDILILDGSPAYLFGYMVNRINLRRAIGDVCAILRGITPSVIIYDHHLLRDARYKERLAPACAMAREQASGNHCR